MKAKLDRTMIDLTPLYESVYLGRKRAKTRQNRQVLNSSRSLPKKSHETGSTSRTKNGTFRKLTPQKSFAKPNMSPEENTGPIITSRPNNSTNSHKIYILNSS